MNSIKAPFRLAFNFLEERMEVLQRGINGDYWTETAQKMSEIAVQGNNSPLLTDLLCTAFDELERQSKKQKGGCY